jgi:hypothetical protein
MVIGESRLAVLECWARCLVFSLPRPNDHAEEQSWPLFATLAWGSEPQSAPASALCLTQHP